jgi:hypothetical protein
LTDVDVSEMLKEAGAPECTPERIACLRAMVECFAAARQDAKRRNPDRPKPRKPRSPRERMAAAAAEFRRAILKEFEQFECEANAFSEDDDGPDWFAAGKSISRRSSGLLR